MDEDMDYPMDLLLPLLRELNGALSALVDATLAWSAKEFEAAFEHLETSLIHLERSADELPFAATAYREELHEIRTNLLPVRSFLEHKVHQLAEGA